MMKKLRHLSEDPLWVNMKPTFLIRCLTLFLNISLLCVGFDLVSVYVSSPLTHTGSF
jgi:hypothetical protein